MKISIIFIVSLGDGGSLGHSLYWPNEKGQEGGMKTNETDEQNSGVDDNDDQIMVFLYEFYDKIFRLW